MTKERFLLEIRQDAHHGRGAVAWAAAIKLPENDKRWRYIEEYDLVGTFGKAFGIEMPTMATGRQKPHCECGSRLTKDGICSKPDLHARIMAERDRSMALQDKIWS